MRDPAAPRHRWGTLTTCLICKAVLLTQMLRYLQNRFDLMARPRAFASSDLNQPLPRIVSGLSASHCAPD
jgi:hypothetical protein